MDNLKKYALLLSLFSSTMTFGIGFDSSFGLEMKVKNGGSSGEAKLTHPRVRGEEVKSGAAKVFNYLNTNALQRNQIEALTYVCLNGRVAIFQNKSNALDGRVTFSSTFSSGRAARSIFPGAFSWLSKLSGMNGSNPSELACRRDFLESVANYRLENLKNVKIGKYELTQKKALFSSKVSMIIKW